MVTMSYEIIQGNCNTVIEQLPEGWAHCAITSPPYWGHRDYNCEGQLGMEPTLEEYVANLVVVMRGVWRVLRKEGTLFLNLGDSYFGGARRAAACGISGKAREDFPESDCLCGSLCGVCRAVYRHTSHTSLLLVSMLRASIPLTIHANSKTLLGRPPTSDCHSQDGRSEASIPQTDEISARAYE